MDLRSLLPYIIGPIITAILAYLIGNRLTAYWGIRQKRREFTISATNEFHKLYGEFFSIWKLWNYSLHKGALSLPEHSQWELLKRAAAAEAGVETIFIRLASERRLDDTAVETLGKFRQAYQQLREAIRDAHKLDWNRHDHPEYLAFKRLASAASHLLATSDTTAQPTVIESQTALIRITSNEWERNWSESIEEPDDLDKELALLEARFISIKEDTPVTINKQTILEIYDKSAAPLIDSLLKMCKKFDKFYVDHDFHLMFNGQSASNTEENAVFESREHLTRHVSKPFDFRFQYVHSSLNQKGFERVGWICGLFFYFELAKFIVETDDKIIRYEKHYGTQLREDEIKELVVYLAKSHRQFLESRIAEVQARTEEIKKTL